MSSYPRACVWIRDVNEEGIEPHPGPRVMCKNLNGVQGENKYWRFMRRLSVEHKNFPILACLTQEHHLKSSDRERHQQVAHFFRFLAIINYEPGGEERGGTAVFIPYDAIQPEDDHETDDEARARVARSAVKGICGRVTKVTLKINGAEMHPTAAYAPVSPPPLRVAFMKKLRSYLTKSSILGIDANCVPDEALDIQRDGNTPYDNAGANELADAVAHFDLSDTAREQLGTKPLFTCHRSTAAGVCHTRIDQLYTPNIDGFAWDHDNKAPYLHKSDHDTLQVQLTECVGERGTDVSRIPEHIFDDVAFNTTVQNAIEQTSRNAPPEEAITDTWLKVKKTVVQLADDRVKTINAQRKRDDKRLNEVIEFLQSRQQSGAAAAHEIHELATKRIERAKARQEAFSLYTTTEEFAAKTGEAHDTGRAAFYRKWTPRNGAQWVNSAFTADWSNPSDPTVTGRASGGPTVANAFKDYYYHLFGPKTPQTAALDRALQVLREGAQVQPPTATKCAAPISPDELLPILQNLPTGKSPGPDRLPNKFYKTFSAILAPLLARVFNHARDHGTPPEMLQGIISVMHKKNKRDDPRNYRPITLLNNDYKVLMRALTQRMNEAVVQFVSPQQNGFVPNSFIAENTMLLNLVKAYVEEEDSEAMFLFADMEKAFDRASWAFMDHALTALGLTDFRPYFHMAYSPNNPPTRQVNVNGYLSDSFPLRSGVAQGCPLSPLLFLLVTEVLSRLIMTDEEYSGVVVNGVHHKISQFADDNVFIMRLGDELRLIIHMQTWERATGMSENDKKREGLLLGALRRRPHLAPNLVRSGWTSDGKAIISLGVPIGNNIDETAWWLGRYRIVKKRISWWRITAGTSLIGRNMLLQSIYYGSFRYWLFSMILPNKVLKLMREDARQLLWASTPAFHTSEEGSSAHIRPFIAELPSMRKRSDGGGNVMHFAHHADGFYAQWGRRYLDPREAPWKSLLDYWIADKYHLGRAALLITIGKHQRIWHDIPKRARYARRCIRTFEDLHIKHAATPPQP